MSTRGLWGRLRQALGHYPSTADEWAVRVQCPDVTRQEFVALDEWLKADPRNAEDYARVNKIAHLGLKLRDHPEARARLFDYPVPQPAPAAAAKDWNSPFVWGRGSWWGARTIAGIASACLVVFVAIALVPELSPFSPRYASGRGEQRQVTLPDGSRMTVNTDSEVRVSFDERERNLDLLRGEAYFEVTKDPARPFVVRAGLAHVRAVGTKFSVRRDVNATEVVVTEGKVQVVREGAASMVGPDSGPIVLTPGDSAKIVAAEPAVQVASIDVARATAWTAGNVEFDEATLADVIRDVNRYTSKEFVIDDPSLNEIRLSGRFRVGDIESVKSALKNRFEIVPFDDGNVIRLSRAH